LDKEKLKSALFDALVMMIPFVPANEFKAVLEAIQKTEADIDRDVENAVDAIRKSSDLITSLELKLRDRFALLEKVKAEHKKLSELSSITKEQTLALSEALRDTIGRASRKERLISFLINLFAGIIVFLLGAIVGPTLTSSLSTLF